ncbi:MAG: M23 family metallopeptidase [Elusimicrobiota bacterium]|jgi:murein DD-endopeptidase MepM/ murein hydrolase activator NlpD|nr:M23 family metallopeptidase [Elusimicrobiota bacterium]
MNIQRIKKELTRKITLMVIHHGNVKPKKISISIIFLCLVAVGWTSVTLWAGYLASRHIDYVRAKADNKVMGFRVLFFANEMEKTRNMLEKAQENDEKIRSLLALKTKKSIIENSLTDESIGEGGPTPSQANALLTVISGGNINNIDYGSLARETERLSVQYQYMQQSYSEVVSHIRQQRALFVATPRGWPAQGILTSRFGFRRNPFFRASTDFHAGLDIANSLGTPVVATANGTVVFSGWQSGYGNIVVVDHGYNYRTAYAHLQTRAVQVGNKVKRGQTVGAMGATGTATGSHVHYEVHFNGKRVNPYSYLTDHFFSQQQEAE